MAEVPAALIVEIRNNEHHHLYYNIENIPDTLCHSDSFIGLAVPGTLPNFNYDAPEKVCNAR